MSSNRQPIALVTGCSKDGMGWYFCKHLRTQGYRVFASARRVSSMEGLETLGCDLLELDVTDSESLSKALSSVSSATNGRLDLLVNNAGRGLVSPILTASLSDIRDLYDANVFGLIACTQTFAPLLIRTAAEGNRAVRPKVVNVGSIAAMQPVPWSGLYASTKGAVHRLSDALRLELGGFGVDVVIIAPGVIKTGFATNVSAYKEAAKDRNLKLEEELYPNLPSILEARRKALYDGPRSEVDEWAAEQVDIMIRAKAPAYHVSGARAWVASLLVPYLPTWVSDRFLGNASGCNQVRYDPKKA